MQEKSFITELTSRTIDVLRFPLAFMVVILHVPYLFPLPFSFGVPKIRKQSQWQSQLQ